MRARSPSPERISHARARLLVSKTWDGEVSERELRLLAAHLAKCPACNAEAEQMHGFFEHLDRCLKARRRESGKR